MRKRRRPGAAAADRAARQAGDAEAGRDGEDADSGRGGEGGSAGPARRSARFAAVLTALAVLLVAAVLVGVYPTRTWLRQERAVHSTQRDLDVLRQQNQRLQEEAARLQDPAEIERLARAEYNLVLPGEEAYAIIPGGTSTTVPQPMVTVIEPDGRVHEVPSSTTPGFVARDPAAAPANQGTTAGPKGATPTATTTATTTPTTRAPAATPTTKRTTAPTAARTVPPSTTTGR